MLRMMPCPKCGELNSVKRKTCYKCQADLYPEPTALRPSKAQVKPVSEQPPAPQPSQAIPTGLTAQSQTPPEPVPPPQLPRPSGLPLGFLLYPILQRVKDDAVFFRQLESLLRAGLNPAQALDELPTRVSSRIRPAVVDMAGQVASGRKLSQAMASHGTVFNPAHLGLVQAGETGGFLVGVLDEIATGLEMEYEFRGRLLANTWFFALLVIAIIIVVPVIFVVIKMPIRTEWNLLNLGIFYLRYFLRFSVPVTAAVIGLIFGLQWMFKHPKGEAWRQKVVLGLPGVGRLAKQAALARFTRTLALLWEAGVPLVPAVENAAAATGNQTIMARIQAIVPALREGVPLSQVLAETELFADETIAMITTGERTGDLPDMLHRAASFYQTDLETAIQTAPRTAQLLLYGIFVCLVFYLLYTFYTKWYDRIFSFADQI